jgi:hypothetical protein
MDRTALHANILPEEIYILVLVLEIDAYAKVGILRLDFAVSGEQAL